MSGMAQPTESVTTDLLLGVVAIIISGYLSQIGHGAPMKAMLWSSVFGLLGIASLLRAITHGMVLADDTRFWLSSGTTIAFGIMSILIIAGVFSDLWSNRAAQWTLVGAGVLGVGLAIAILLRIEIGYLITMIVGVGWGVAFVGYTWLALCQSMPGRWSLVIGSLLSGGTAMAPVWRESPDNSDALVLLQIAGLVVLMVGLRSSLLHAAARNRTHYESWGQE